MGGEVVAVSSWEGRKKGTAMMVPLRVVPKVGATVEILFYKNGELVR